MSRKIIIDCDPGIDDSLAIMLALSMESRLEVVGITIAAGNSPVDMGWQNALKILKFMGRLDIPVIMGAEKPLCRSYINALDTHGSDGLGESFLPQVPPGDYAAAASVVFPYQRALTPSPSAAFMADILMKEPVSIISLGPMTNLAILAQQSPEAFDNIEELVSMGGSFKSHGNCSPVAEYNYRCDPDAAAIVYREMDKRNRLIHMVGLDVTRKIVLTPDLLAYMKRLRPQVGSFVEKITKFYFDFHWEWEHLIGCVINDPLAIAYFTERELCSGFESYVDIQTQGIGIGQSIVDSMNFYRHKPNAVVLTEVDTESFFRLFFSNILGFDKKELDLLPALLRTQV